MPYLSQYLPFYLSAPPTASTLPATGVTSAKATLNGTVDPNGLLADYWFEYFRDDWLTSGWETRTNQVTNPSAETGTGLIGTGADGGGERTLTNPAANPGEAEDGSKVFRLAGKAGTGGNAYIYAPSVGIATSTTQRWYLRGKFTGTIPAGRKLRLILWSGGPNYAQVTAVELGPGEYTGQVVEGFATATAQFEKAYLLAMLSGMSNGEAFDWRIDGLVLCAVGAADLAPGYFPTPTQLASGQAVWTGTEHASSSKLAVPLNAPVGKDGEAGEGSEAGAVSEVIEGLTNKARYHFRLVAVNAGGEAFGEDLTFQAGYSVVAVVREHPPDRLAVRIADPSTGASIARWAEDESRAENIISRLTKSGEMDGGHKESGGMLARDPRVDWPDLDTYYDYIVEGAGGEKLWGGRLEQKPQSDGERWMIEPKAGGHSKALEDRTALRLGFIDSELSKWGEPSTQRRLDLINAGIRLMASTSVGHSSADLEAVLASIINDFTNVTTVTTDTEAGEAHYYGGGVDIGEVLYDFLGDLAGGGADAGWENNLALGKTDTFATAVTGTDHNATAASQQNVEATGSGYKFARIRDRLAAVSEGVDLKRIFAWQPRVIGNHGLALQGTWPQVGFTAKQMIELAVPLYSYLEAREEDIEDTGYVITQAWYSDPTTLDAVIKDVLKYSPEMRWFILNGKRLELRRAGTFGREWQAYAGPSELRETGEDGSRLWDRIVVAYQDVSGRTVTIGYPGSGADSESEQLIISDPDHPAVKADRPREDLLNLNGISEFEPALAAGERWLAEANELSHAGEATLRGYIQDSASVFRPVSQVQPGSRVRFPDAGSGGTGYREIVAVSYDHESRTASVTLDAPSSEISALLERYQAALSPLAL